jgi:hypothetical protein
MAVVCSLDSKLQIVMTRPQFVNFLPNQDRLWASHGRRRAQLLSFAKVPQRLLRGDHIEGDDPTVFPPRLQAQGLALSQRPLAGLPQDEEPRLTKRAGSCGASRRPISAALPRRSPRRSRDGALGEPMLPEAPMPALATELVHDTRHEASPSSHPIPNSKFRHANERIGKDKSQ